MKATTSKFIINELEVSYQELNRAISMLRNRQLRFCLDLDQIVRNICTDHQAKTTRYTKLVKGHIDEAVQQKKKRKRAMKKNSIPPPLNGKPVGPIVETQQKDFAPKPPIQQEPAVKDSVPEPSTVAKKVPQPRPSKDVPATSLVKDGFPLVKSVTEEGEIPQSEPNAHQ